MVLQGVSREHCHRKGKHSIMLMKPPSPPPFTLSLPITFMTNKLGQEDTPVSVVLTCQVIPATILKGVMHLFTEPHKY